MLSTILYKLKAIKMLVLRTGFRMINTKFSAMVILQKGTMTKI